MAISESRPARAVPELAALRDENRTLYGVIRLVSSALELEPMLQGVVELATQATGCHACFIYLLEGERLTIRAASPVFAQAVGTVSFAADEGLTGWVAVHRTPAFIREGAMDDPRMKYIPELREEDFQSMVAVPILARAGHTIGVIVLHTKAPREFGEDALKLLAHIASLVSGAIENAQLYDRQRRRVEALTRLSELSQQVAEATTIEALGPVLADGLRALLGAEVCQVLRTDLRSGNLALLASSPRGVARPDRRSLERVVSGAPDRPARGAAGREVFKRPDLDDLLVAPLSAAGERLGLLCAGAGPSRAFDDEDVEIARAVAHLAAVAVKRAELIESLTNASIVKDIFESLAAGASAFAADKAAEIGCDLSGAYLLLCASPAGTRDAAAADWPAAAADLGRALVELAPASAVQPGPGPVRALLMLGRTPERAAEAILRSARELGQEFGAVVGVSEFRRGPDEAAGAFREARDAVTIAHALLSGGGAIAYAQVGAYRYLVQIAAGDAPRDRMQAAVDRLIAYDRRRRTALLDTLERYLSERRSVIESARALFIHPNTLRQRLGRIEELTGLALDHDDLLSLELAIKLARLHGRPGAA